MARWTDPLVLKWLSSLITPITTAPFSPPDEYYEAPSWMEHLLTGAPEAQPGR
jgi:hypothetical protein